MKIKIVNPEINQWFNCTLKLNEVYDVYDNYPDGIYGFTCHAISVRIDDMVYIFPKSWIVEIIE